MPEKIDLGYALKLAPKDAVAYFEAKGYKIGWNWFDVWQEAQAKSFTIAKAARVDILEDVRSEISRALKEGVTEREFVKTLTPRLQARGWWGKQIIVDSEGRAEVAQLGSPWRLKTIYRTNMQTAYMAAREKFQRENADRRPYWQYLAVMDARTRPAHAALHGKVFRADDPFWDTHYPPLGFNCRCRVRALSEARLKAEGLAVESSEGRMEEKEVDAGLDKRTGEMRRATVTGLRTLGRDGSETVVWTDPGWDYNPGKAAFGTDVEIMRKVSLVSDQALRTQAVQALNNSELRHAAFAAWVTRALTERRPGHDAQTIGFVDEPIADFVRAQGVEPARVLVLPHRRLVHADSEAHQAAGIALSQEEYRRLPQLVAQPQAVYWDNKYGNLVYTADADDGKVYYLPVNIAEHVKRRGVLDVMVNAYRVPASRLADKRRYLRMEGKRP